MRLAPDSHQGGRRVGRALPPRQFSRWKLQAPAFWQSRDGDPRQARGDAGCLRVAGLCAIFGLAQTRVVHRAQRLHAGRSRRVHAVAARTERHLVAVVLAAQQQLLAAEKLGSAETQTRSSAASSLTTHQPRKAKTMTTAELTNYDFRFANALPPSDPLY